MSPKIHELKILPEYYSAVVSGKKRFELRKNDRDFRAGDILRLEEWDGHEYTGRATDVMVLYILLEYAGALAPGYCIMSIEVMGCDEA